MFLHKNQWDFEKYLSGLTMQQNHLHLEILPFLFSYLSENPYTCNCDLEMYLKMSHKNSTNVEIADENLMTCDTPDKLKGRLISGLGKKDVCPEGRYHYYSYFVELHGHHNHHHYHHHHHHNNNHNQHTTIITIIITVIISITITITIIITIIITINIPL